ncbi:hypothetical protein ACFZBM_05100 [Streptomyces lavendulae]|uniref:Uncharacterized protein n=1 Tax=Streptomyces lavendulae subsp. lavendulae TaxID=58340 RepID=A0A2K8PC46_STRLA|nr:hypothetical protein [Streptomyces lavendulae]ATZ24306.1 hypothetical protein SLAV_12235 [Streptomyces lavendulae subsp. lavendulae]QUQ54136.1 hypothetical protein SLLC_10280 [Streptomyces lavendulae subsp. lavendulae]
MDTTKTLAPTAAETDAAGEQAAPDTAAATTAAEGAAPADGAAEPAVEAAAATETPAAAEAGAAGDEDAEFDEDAADGEDSGHGSGVGAAATSIVAAGLGLVALSGSWVSRVIAERQTLIGQIESVNATTAKEKIAALYGDAWHMTALVNGVLSTLALLLAAFVLARPAFGTPGRVLPVWVRSVSWAAVALGVLGVLVFGLMYFDLLVALPTAAQ